MRRLIGKALEQAWSSEVASHYRDAVVLESAGAEAVEAYQLRKLNRIVSHFRAIGVWEALFAQAGTPAGPIESLSEMDVLPIIGKGEIGERLSAIQAGPHALRRNATSGSTGRNFVFYQSKSMLTARRAVYRRGCEWMGIDPYADRSVYVWGRSPAMGYGQRIKLALKRGLNNGLMLDGFGLDRERCLEHLARIRQFKPKLLEGYPNYLLALAHAGRESGIEPFRPHAMVSSGEALFDTTREEIEGYFQAPLYNRYGSREFGPVAHQCSARASMHIHALRFIVESDENGELLITDLDNLATPFIRYPVGDSGKVEYVKCACGRSLPSLVEMMGRSHDIIVTPKGRQLPGHFWTIVSKVIPGIEEFQVVQKSATDLEMRVKVTDAFCDDKVGILRDKVLELAGEPMTFSFVKVERIEPTAAGKRRFIINEMASNSNGRGA